LSTLRFFLKKFLKFVYITSMFGILLQAVPGVCLLSGSFSSMSRSLSTLRLGTLLQAVPGVYLLSGRFQYLIYSQVRRKHKVLS
jgi:hypothetical protein